jgi:hypothetical protein
LLHVTGQGRRGERTWEVADFAGSEKGGIAEIVGHHDRGIQRSEIEGGDGNVEGRLGGNNDGALVALAVLSRRLVDLDCAQQNRKVVRGEFSNSEGV